MLENLLKSVFATRELNALKKGFAAIMVIIEVVLFLTIGIPMTPNGQKLDLDGYSLVFEDNFDGTSLDMTKWEYRGSGKRGGGYISPNQVKVDNGKLTMKAEYRADGEYGDGWYSGMIRTVEEFKNGYFEIRCICNKGVDFWSAYWLNSTGMASAELSNGGIGGSEIDIFESLCNDKKIGKNAVSQNVHVGGYGDGLQSEHLGEFKVPNPYTEYNTYGVEWTEDEYIFYINGVESTRSSFQKGVSEALEYVILSMEPKSEIKCSATESFEYITDYVRVYQK